MTSTLDRQTAVVLINEAVVAGARRCTACGVLQISERTFRRWTEGGAVRSDQRPLVQRPAPAIKLSETERAAVLEVCNSKEFSDLPPSQIAPKLADGGRYLASESSFYRILRAEGQQHHRGRAKPPNKRKPPTSSRANAPCEVWTWDITASYSRPRVSNNNPFSEALFRTFKYRPNWPSKGFATKVDAQAWVKSFADWYNNEHLHSAIRFVTPNARHSGIDPKTLANRAILYATARALNPQRWSGKTRNWKPAGPVWLNPENEIASLKLETLHEIGGQLV